MSRIPCQCNICFSVYDLAEFRFMQCGHGVCTSCTDRTSESTKCSVCRAARGAHVPHAVYIDRVEDTPSAEANRLTQDLTTLCQDPSLDNFRNLATRLREPQHQSGLSAEEKEKLFGAARLLDKQIFPLMQRKEMYKVKFAHAQAENDYLAKEVDSLREEVQRLRVDRARILRLEREKADLLGKVEAAKSEKSDLRKKLKRLVESSALEKAALEEKLHWARAPSFNRLGLRETRPKRWRNSASLNGRNRREEQRKQGQRAD